MPPLFSDDQVIYRREQNISIQTDVLVATDATFWLIFFKILCTTSESISVINEKEIIVTNLTGAIMERTLVELSMTIPISYLN